jgi:hypothetical protein
MSVYDPLGFLGYLTIKAKIILQEIWRSGIGWDDEIANSTHEKWTAWLKELKLISSMKIPRCYSLDLKMDGHNQLHVFCDASEQAYCVVAYLRSAGSDGVSTAFIMSKTHVAPLNSTSIARLELQAAVLATRLAETIRCNHDIYFEETHFWSDSKTVLLWIRSDGKKFQQFVAHRVGEIQEATNVNQWHWVPTKENVADEATRDGTPCDFSSSCRWLNGPSFLKLEKIQWPQEDFRKQNEVDQEQLEVKKDKVFLIREEQLVIDWNRYSSFLKVKRVVAWMRRMFRRQKSPTLTVEELDQSEKLVMKLDQAEMFYEEIDCIKLGKEINNKSSLVQLSPFLDEFGILRSRSRLQLAEWMCYDAKCPVILHPKSQLVKMIIADLRYQFNYQGVETVVNEMRQRYHVSALRSVVKKVFSNCQKCKNQKITPKVPEMGNNSGFQTSTEYLPVLQDWS